MSLQPSSPVTGAALTGFTSPTYTLTEDQAPNGNVRRFVVTGLGGTQAGVETHSVSSPFYLDVSRPNQVKALPRANPSTSLYPSIPVNEYHVKLYKGASITAGSTSTEVTMLVDAKIRIPAGVELSANDPEEIKAMLSAFGGFFYANASGLYDLVSTGMIK